MKSYLRRPSTKRARARSSRAKWTIFSRKDIGWSDDGLRLIRQLAEAGIQSAQLLSTRYTREAFGDGEVVFQVGSLLLRISRERGQYLLDLATANAADHFYPFEDVEAALGWRPLAEVVSGTELDQIRDVLRRFRLRRDEIERALSGPHEADTRANIKDVAAQRGLAFYRKARGS